MPDNTKSGIIDLTEIVEMGTPPDPVEKTIPASSAGTVDFESELEDLFNATDFSEFADSVDPKSQPEESLAEPLTDTPKNEPVVDDLLAGLTPEPAAPATDLVADAAPSFESDLDELLDSGDSNDSSIGFDADFEDLLNDFAEPSASASAPAYQPDFDEDLSSMSMNSAPSEAVGAEPAPQPQAVATEQATETNIADVTDADVDDLFADLDFELGEASVEPKASSAPVINEPAEAADAEIDDLLADFDFEAAPVQEPVSQSAPAQTAPQESADDDLFGDLGLDFEMDEEVAPPQAAPATENNVADINNADVDDLFSDLDFELGEAPKEDPVEAVAKPVSQPSAPVEDISLEDPFDVDNILNEVSDDIPPSAQAEDDMDIADLDALLSLADDPAPAPRTDLSPAEGTTLESEEVEMDDIGFLLSELDENDGAPVVGEPIAEPKAEAAPEELFEPSVPEETVFPEMKEPSAPIDPSMFDAEIDALLDDIEMASAEPSTPMTSELEPTPEPETLASVSEGETLAAEPISTPAAPEDDLDLDALLEGDPFGGEETQEPATANTGEASSGFEDELAEELDSLLGDTSLENASTQEVQPAAEDISVAGESASPLGSADEFESILDELDSLLDEQQALEPVMEASSEDPVDELLSTSDEDDLDLDFESEPALDADPEVATEPVEDTELLAEPTSLEEDLDSTLDRILGEDPLSADSMNSVEEEAAQLSEEPAEFTHDDIDELLTGVEDEDGVEEIVSDIPVEDLPAEEVQEDPLFAVEEVPAENAPVVEEMFAEPSIDVDEDEPVSIASEASEPMESMPQEENSVSEAMDTLEQDVPMSELEQEVMTDLEALAEVPDEVSAPELDMVDINENAAPVPPDASIEDLMRNSSMTSPEFNHSSMELLDTTPEVASGAQAEAPYDVPPAPTMTAEEFAELTERIYYLESTLQNVVAMQESFAAPQPAALDKNVLAQAIDEAFNLDGPLMARVLGAVEVRTEMMIQSMGNRVEKQIAGTIEQAAAKSAAQVIREELKALLTEEFS